MSGEDREQKERKLLKVRPWGIHLSLRVCSARPVTESVTITCRVLLTFPSAVEGVWTARIRLTLETQCHLHSSHGRQKRGSIVVIPVMPRHQWQEMPSLLKLRGKRWRFGAVLASQLPGRHAANMVPIWQISVIYHHAIDQWFLVWSSHPRPMGLKVIFWNRGTNWIKKQIVNYVNVLFLW